MQMLIFIACIYCLGIHIYFLNICMNTEFKQRFKKIMSAIMVVSSFLGIYSSLSMVQNDTILTSIMTIWVSLMGMVIVSLLSKLNK